MGQRLTWIRPIWIATARRPYFPSISIVERFSCSSDDFALFHRPHLPGLLKVAIVDASKAWRLLNIPFFPLLFLVFITSFQSRLWMAFIVGTSVFLGFWICIEMMKFAKLGRSKWRKTSGIFLTIIVDSLLRSLSWNGSFTKPFATIRVFPTMCVKSIVISCRSCQEIVRSLDWGIAAFSPVGLGVSTSFSVFLVSFSVIWRPKVL